MDKKICPICGKPNGRNKICCSKKCYAEYRQNYAECPVCGTIFKHSPSDTTTHTCGSDECKKVWRKEHTPKEQIKYAHEHLRTNPKTGHFDTHHASADWDIIAPDGTRFTFKNLVLWAEKHADILPISPRTGERVQPKTFVREITRLKSDCEKYTYFRDNYHGWRINKSKD